MKKYLFILLLLLILFIIFKSVSYNNKDFYSIIDSNIKLNKTGFLW
jgi:thioredoxin-related protein